MLNKLIEKIVAQIVEQLNKAIEHNSITKIERLQLQPGDLIVIKSKYVLSAQAVDNLTKSVKEIFPNNEHKVIALEEDMDIAVISGAASDS